MIIIHRMNKKYSVPVVDTIIKKDNRIILIKRKNYPFKNKLVIPGGKVIYNETVEHAAIREAKEETGLKVRLKEILGIYSNPKRDPRWHSISTVFIAEPITDKLKEGFEGKPRWYPLDKIDFKNLGFDHAKILKDYIKWKKSGGTFWSSKA